MVGALRSLRRGLAIGPVVLAAGAGCLTGAAPAAAATTPAVAAEQVIVSLQDASRVAGVEALVRRSGGTVQRELPIVDGFTAQVSPALVTTLRATAGVRSVTANSTGHLKAVDPALGYDATKDEGSLSFVRNTMHVNDAWKAGYTGKGVDVALIDSGVATVPGLTSGNVVNGPDLSFESQYADVRYRDTFGHGTHMASIIAGRDSAGTPAQYSASTGFTGMAPDARIVSLKVAASDGSADVSQVIAAIGWVAQHAHDSGLNIRVLNLSYGTDSTQSSVLDPLSYAVEQAWRRGIVVVVSAGNDGTTREELADPASNPYVIAVGAEDPKNTAGAADDLIPAFAQRGTGTRHVDVVAPGVHILGLRVPNSYVDQNNPAGRVGTRFIRGSGTSQATAVVSGVAALLAQKYPAATPDQIKWLITAKANPFPLAKSIWQGTGLVDVHMSLGLNPASAPVQNFTATTGLGTLEGARGSGHVLIDGIPLTGEKDIFGQSWNVARTAWSGGTFNGTTWTGTGWDPSTAGWTAPSWTGSDWTGRSWAGRSWAGRSWADNGWDGRSWASNCWYGRSWASDGWADASWS
ncbi:peptidase S8 and S53 subtilisin kexin sedolisin [Actinoplanes sp. SE50]|uniref:S8 family serine peptidase n=1 Tax=unclassified Actinoplanes TaxID=2626549 RepID=UPI00023EC55A|nr:MULTISPECIES: S8 family serine peptidase [unclassified Actinoplanes]AEV81404.1 peptidase S8 and S53 subtilisin kexin sedolisin [Actinoplanes sp. SE50/110]ATO79807.1 peptidase S8 and S53 subtilisin kexin sedolisin [Actinoplanes sp. SE50]SLL97209.1 peptidase S8 [Actinoplanes sp. SE50/110]